MTQQRKFKHKQTGYIAKEECDCLNWTLYGPDGKDNIGIINSKVVTKGSDWQEITEPELVEGRWYKRGRIAGRWDGDKKPIGMPVLRDCVDLMKNKTSSQVVCDVKNLDKCTTSEIHQALEVIRKHKGLVEGVEVKDVNGEVIELEREGTCYLKAYDALMGNHAAGKGTCIYSGTLYKQGQWATKVEEPVLVTEDNCKVFKGDYFYRVKDGYMALFQAHSTEPKNWDGKYFYHKENAQAYIDRNKPKYSEEDLEYLEQELVKISRYAVMPIEKIKNLIEDLKQSK